MWQKSIKNGHFTQTEQDTDLLFEELELRNLVLHNDDINTFDWVIFSLMAICNHSQTQAEQLTVLVHFKGKALVKKGSFDDLKPLKDEFIDRGINATID